MTTTRDNLTFCGDMDAETLHELLLNNFEPLPQDPWSEISPEDLAAYRLDMMAMPLDLPTAAEVEEMARALGLDEVPF